MNKKIIKYIKKPLKVVTFLGTRGYLNWVSDKQYLKLAYKAHIGRKLNIDNPKSYTEKLQWAKLYDRNPLYIKLADKYEVKSIVSDLIGKEFCIPTLGIWNTVNEIDFDKLPNEFVLKCTHDSGSVVICRDKSKLNIEETKKRLNYYITKSPYWNVREWAYKDIKPRIIAEKLMKNSNGSELKDYKFFCFDGEPKALFVASDRFKEDEDTKFDFYDMKFEHLPIRNGHPNSTREIEKPITFQKMKELAAILSKGIPHVRIDFYEIDGNIYFGEFTFYHFGGIVNFDPEEWDYKFGEWFKLPVIDQK